MAKSDKPDTQSDAGKEEPEQKVKDESVSPSAEQRVPEDPAMEASGERPDAADAGTDPDVARPDPAGLPEPEIPEKLPENPWKTSPEADKAADAERADVAESNVQEAAKPEPEDAFAPDTSETAAVAEDTGRSGAETPEAEKTDTAGTEPPAAPVSAAVRTPEPEPRRGGFLPLLLGGAIAAILGFIAARGEWIDPYLPEEYRQASVDLAPLQARLDAQVEENEALTARLEELSAALEELAGAAPEASEVPEEVSSELVTLAGRIEALEELQARVEMLEARPVVEAPSEQIATTADVAGLQAALNAQRAEIEALAEQARAAEENAQSEAQKVLAQAALARLSAAVDSGEPFEPALGALEDVAAVPVPDALQNAAAEGVATLSELQASFPAAARDALSAVRAEIPEGDVSGLGGFLRRQLGARSVIPRDGEDADAVLSRAEAAVRQGALDTALAELEALPESGRAAMRDWIDSAEARNAVRQAAAGLEDSLTSN